MSKMSTIPVFKCKYCGRPVYATQLETTIPDPSTTMLTEMMSNLSKIAICDNCLAAYNYFAGQGRSEEFIRGVISPINLDTKRQHE